MEPHANSNKEIAALARRKRKQILKDRRSKKLRNIDNFYNHYEASQMYYAPSRPIIRTLLSNITSTVLNERNMFSHSPGIATGNGISMKNFESVSTKQVAAFARERRKQILQRRISQSHDENFDKNSPSCFRINTPSFTHLVTPPSNITSPHSNARNLNMSAQPSTSAYKSKKQMNVGAIQSMSVKLLNYFANENHDPSSSSTPNSPVHDASTFNSVPNFNIAMHNSVDDTSTDDSISDSSCEVNVADGNYDSSSSLDDDEAFQYNSSSIDSCNIGHNRFQDGRGPPNLRIHGQVCDRIGSMLPLPGESPKFAQLYIFDTDNEVQNRIEAIGSTDGRIYNHPTVSEVAALIVGDVDTGHKRDILLERQSGQLKRIKQNANTQGSNKGKRVVLPSTYVGSRRFMEQLYFDGMVICSHFGFPDLFITFTCNPNWPEIQRLVAKNNLNSQDRPNIISRVFKIKFDELLCDLTKKHVLGRVVAYIYTIEFQKRGLPHSHILLFLHPSSKYPTPDDIDKIISAEIPTEQDDKPLYDLVKTHMIHGPCGIVNRSSPCMKDGKCSKYFPKKFQPQTIVDQDGYPMYRRRETGNTVMKKQVQLDNRSPTVERLYFHLEGDNSVYYTDYELIDEVLDKPSVKESMFTAWMEANKIYFEAQNLTYSQFLSKFVYDRRYRRWRPRKRGHTIGRLIWVPPSTGELYYLRMMLTVVKGPTFYEDIKFVDGKVQDSFRDACFHMRFLNDDSEYVAAINEAKDWGSEHFLRKLFVTMLLSGTVNRPRHVWEQTWRTLSNGILYQQRQNTNTRELQLSDTTELKNLTLIEIENMMQSNRRSLHEFTCMPYPDNYVTKHVGNRLIYDELDYNAEKEQKNFEELFHALTDEQLAIYHTIMDAVNKKRGGVFFLHGYGGTGKNFMWRTLSSALRSQKKIVLTVASSGIASLLLPGGRTAHSKFKIPVPTLDNSTCNIDKDTDHSQLLEATDVIIWDEAPMSHRHCFEALDKTLKDVMSKKGFQNAIFGGKVVVFEGDFRQILPVVPRASRSDIVHASISSSYVWEYCQVLKLTKNMRLRHGRDNTSSDKLAKFSKWILQVGDGKISEPNDGLVDIEIPKELLISNFEDPIRAIVDYTYPNLLEKFQDVTFLQGKAILASTIEVVDRINDYILDLIPGEEKEYLSFDSIDRTDTTYNESYEVLTPEFLSKLRTSGIPNHKIKLKVGTPIMLMRNLDQVDGLCNGTRLIVTRLANHVIEAKIMSGKNIGNIFYIPRMSMSPSDSPWPFKLIQRQFPIIVSYAMTINKSQGQSLDSVGLYLPTPVFSHGQLYVAISRVKSKSGLKILIHDKDNSPCSTTTNVVYKEVFEALG
ncbi:hypothetical protein KIW84_072535 [Lathyrus oleraceus]|uniref:ATP-dependent DNA helicase n=1 Tax=Pisum sativum TaxID=3888 RepID=A0A9D4VM16_PEA|nr:hypothetical protein KIW84_072535 [Pisum sativum]